MAPRLTVRSQIVKCARRGTEKVRKEIGKEGKDHRGLPIQIMHTLTKSWVVYFRNKSKKTRGALGIPKGVNSLPISALSPK
jgi:hypothetical protein